MLYLLFLSALVAGARAASFIGCASGRATDDAPVASVDSAPYSSCNTNCAGYKYSFTMVPTSDGVTTDCSCSNDLAGTAFADQSGSKQCSQGDYAIQDVDSDYSYGMCYQYETSGPAEYAWGAQDPDACSIECKYNKYMYSGRYGTGWRCYCADETPDTTKVTADADCGDNTFAAYEHTPYPRPSHDGAHRKRIKERLLARQRQKTLGLCPGPMQPCRVQGADAYECIDVTTELESCGGCMYGVYGTDFAPAPKHAKMGME